MKNKKSTTTFEVIMWIPRILFLVVLMFAIMLLIRSFVNTTIDSSELQANVFANRVLYSTNAISYVDPDTQRVYPGIVDLDKLKSAISDKSLEKSISYGKKNLEIGAKFSVNDMKENKIDFFYNEDFFREQEKIAGSGFTEGPGGAKLYVKNYNIIVQKGSVLTNGVLTMSIVIPNS
ncbi:MAG TPA: hypothetical protein VJI52_00445 [Candidatus Nanoarchaeia archaeon]|nr:hypothetical protein [Candidatus Nanoarchaeia archaeon]